MNRQLVIGNKGYALNTSNAAITNANKINTLAEGSWVVTLDGKVITAAEAATAVANKSGELQIFVGVKGGGVKGIPSVITSVPLNIREFLLMSVAYNKASVSKIVEIDFTGVNVEAEGEGTITFSDLSYIRTIKNDRIIASLYKRKSQTVAQVVTKLAEKINNHNLSYAVTTNFISAVANGTKLTVTTTDANVDLSISSDGLFAYVPVKVTRQPVVSLTEVEDLLRSEEEFSGVEGNGGYQCLGDRFFSFPSQVNTSAKYHIVNLTFQGNHDTPQNRVRSAVMNLKIAFSALKDLETFLAIFTPAVEEVSEGQVVIDLGDADKDGDGEADPSV